MDMHPQVICWNVRGLNNQAKRKAVCDFVSMVKVNLACLQETELDVIDQYMVMQRLGPSFDGHAYLPAVDTRGGILLAWDGTTLTVDNVVLNDNFLTGLVHTKVGQPWWITVVYGPQGDELKTQFLEDLKNRRVGCLGPWMVLGDFNMIIRPTDKNNTNINRRMMSKFRDFVDEHELKEMYMHGRRYTWSNERDAPTLTKIDGILSTVDWELDNAEYLLQALSTWVSDHAPLLLTTSVGFSPKHRFRFEMFWTKLDGFEEAVTEAWVCDPDIVDPYKRLDTLLRNTARHLQAWGQRKMGNV